VIIWVKLVLNVLFFASARERLGMDRVTCAFTQTIDALISALSRAHGAQCEEVLRAPNIIVAVNHQVVTRDHILRDGDEVAFYPPVTGG
jgi:molybdopterin synthase sulfur carrier subunit